MSFTIVSLAFHAATGGLINYSALKVRLKISCNTIAVIGFFSSFKQTAPESPGVHSVGTKQLWRIRATWISELHLQTNLTCKAQLLNRIKASSCCQQLRAAQLGCRALNVSLSLLTCWYCLLTPSFFDTQTLDCDKQKCFNYKMNRNWH